MKILAVLGSLEHSCRLGFAGRRRWNILAVLGSLDDEEHAPHITFWLSSGNSNISRIEQETDTSRNFDQTINLRITSISVLLMLTMFLC